MSIKWLAVVLVLLSGVARADLNFTFVNGATNGVGPVLVAHKQAATALGKTGWLWGTQVWSDPSGSYLYFAYHSYGTGFLFKRNPDGSYTNISPVEPDATHQRPKENRPTLMDADNNGFMDILHTGDETQNSASLLNDGSGVWRFSRAHRLAWRGSVVDANADGYLDVVGYSAGATYGSGVFRTITNTSGTGFSRADVPVVMPEGCPQVIIDRLALAQDRYHYPRVYDLDASTYIVTYGGSYSGQKFTYTVRNDQVVNIGLPSAGTAHKPVDMDGDGDLDVVVQWTASAGVYRQANGVFTKDVAGYMPTINTALASGSTAYMWDVFPVDLDRDGDNDLVLSNKRSLKGWILDNKSGTYSLHKAISHVDGEPVSVGDADGDGDIDVVYAGGSARNGDQAGFYINQVAQ